MLLPFVIEGADVHSILRSVMGTSSDEKLSFLQPVFSTHCKVLYNFVPVGKRFSRNHFVRPKPELFQNVGSFGFTFGIKNTIILQSEN